MRTRNSRRVGTRLNVGRFNGDAVATMSHRSHKQAGTLRNGGLLAEHGLTAKPAIASCQLGASEVLVRRSR